MFVEPALIQYAVKLVNASRDPARAGAEKLATYLTFGASPRASIHLVEAARAMALLRGRNYVRPEDMTDLAADVLRHRLVLSYEAIADGLDADQIITQLMNVVVAPDKPMESHEAVSAAA